MKIRWTPGKLFEALGFGFAAVGVLVFGRILMQGAWPPTSEAAYLDLARALFFTTTGGFFVGIGLITDWFRRHLDAPPSWVRLATALLVATCGILLGGFVGNLALGFRFMLAVVFGLLVVGVCLAGLVYGLRHARHKMAS